MIRVDKCRMSIMFSNMSKPLRHLPLPRSNGRVVAGNVTLEGMELVGAPSLFVRECVRRLVRQPAEFHPSL